MKIYSPIKGKLKKTKSLDDDVFVEDILGKGVAITPEDGNLYSPIKGKLVSVFPTGHAYGIEAKDGTKVLVHAGIDTVELEGKGFDVKVKQNKKVKEGTLLAKLDLDYLNKNAKSSDIIVLVTTDSETEVIDRKEVGDVNIQDIIITTK